MKNAILLFTKAVFFSFLLVGFFSCSTEDVAEPVSVSKSLDSELSGLSTFKTWPTGCSSSIIPTTPYSYSDYVSVGNGSQEKTLRTKVYNTDTHIFVEADYVASVNNENLPAKVTIDIGGTVFSFSDVQPSETVKVNLPIKQEWFGSYVDVYVEQLAFLEPAEVLVEEYIDEPCPLEVGAELMGGTVGYVLQPGDPGYIEGETHGLIVSSQEIVEGGTMTWSEAMAAAENLELNGYDDWTLPTGTEAISLLSTLTGEFSYDPLYSSGYWTSIEVDETTALRATIEGTGRFYDPITIETSPWSKNYPLEVRVVRSF